MAQELARRGCHVAVSYRRSRRSAEETIEAVGSLGVRGLAIESDLAAEPAAAALVERVVRQLGRLDVLICMASRYEQEAFETLDAGAWQAGLDADLRSIYLLALQAAPLKAWGGKAANANNVMYLRLMEYAVQKGLRWFDFNRSRRDNRGPHAFKRYHGFEPAPLHYQVFMNKIAELPNLSPSNKKYALAGRVWKKLPLWLTGPAGSQITKWIP